VKLARFGNHTDQIIKISSTCVKSTERFVQLGNGWVLRELSLADLDLVVKFIKENYENFSREGLRYAIEKMETKLRTKLMKFKVGEDSESDGNEDSESAISSENSSEESSDSGDEAPAKKTSKKRKLSESDDKEEPKQPKKLLRKKSTQNVSNAKKSK